MEYNEAIYAGKLHGQNKVKSERLQDGRIIRDYYYLPEDKIAVVTDTFPQASGEDEDDVSYDELEVVTVSDQISTLV